MALERGRRFENGGGTWPIERSKIMIRSPVQKPRYAHYATIGGITKTLIYIPVLLLLLTYGALFFFFKSLTPLDTQLFLEIFDLRTPALDTFFVLWTNGGSFFFISLVVLILWLNGERRPAVYLAAGVIVDLVLVIALKTVIHRPRPYDSLSITPLEMGDIFGSMPSGHSSRAFLSAMILSNFYRKYAVIFFFLAASIGISRVYLGAHYPLDVIIGTINGVLMGILVINLCDRFRGEIG